MTRIAVALVASAALACAGSREAKKPAAVSEADYGRLQPGQTQMVDQARADQGNARDALARAKLRQAEARNEAELATADLKVADAEQMRANAAAKMAKASNDPVQLEQARAAGESADLRRRTAEAHRDYSQKLQATRDAEVAAAEQRVAYEEARVEHAKLQALQQAQIPAATKYQPAELEARVANARNDYEAAENRARTLQAELANAERQWKELNRQMQARGAAAGTRG